MSSFFFFLVVTYTQGRAVISVFSCPLGLYSAMGSSYNNLTLDSGILGIEGLPGEFSPM